MSTSLTKGENILQITQCDITSGKKFQLNKKLAFYNIYFEKS